MCVAYGSKSSSSSDQFPLASPSARLISRSVHHELAPMRQLRACASYQLTPGTVYRVFLPDFWRAVNYYVDTSDDVEYAGASLSRLVFNSSMSLAVLMPNTHRRRDSTVDSTRQLSRIGVGFFITRRPAHRRRRRGQGGGQIREKIFLGQLLCKIMAFFVAKNM